MTFQLCIAPVCAQTAESQAQFEKLVAQSSAPVPFPLSAARYLDLVQPTVPVQNPQSSPHDTAVLGYGRRSLPPLLPPPPLPPPLLPPPPCLSRLRAELSTG